MYHRTSEWGHRPVVQYRAGGYHFDINLLENSGPWFVACQAAEKLQRKKENAPETQIKETLVAQNSILYEQYEHERVRRVANGICEVRNGTLRALLLRLRLMQETNLTVLLLGSARWVYMLSQVFFTD